MIRVVLGGPRCHYRLPPEMVGGGGLLGLFKRKTHPGIDMELHMEKRDGGQGNQLDITLLLKPVTPKPAAVKKDAAKDAKKKDGKGANASCGEGTCGG